MRTVDIERTAYPQLRPNITDVQVIEHYTLSEAELSLVKGYRGSKLALAVRLRLTEHLLRSNFALSLVPQKVIDYVASQLGIVAEELLETRATRYEQIQICREFFHFSAFSDAEAKKLETWLVVQAFKQFHLIDLVNEAIFHLKEISVELPAFGRLVRFAAAAQAEADKSQKRLLYQSLSPEQKEKLDALLLSELRYHRTPFYELKEPPESPTASAIQKEVGLLQRLRAFDICFEVLQQISIEKIKHFFEIAKSYKSNELADLLPETRHPILLCFIYVRIKQVTDNIVELLFRLWNQITKDSQKAQDQ